MSINGILLVAGTKFGPKFSRDFCSSVNSVSVKLMTACFIYDVVFYVLFFPVLFFSVSNSLIRWFFFFVNSVSLDFSVVRSISAKCSSFTLLFKLSQICFTFTVASCIRCLAQRRKFGPKFSRDFCSSVNSVSVKLMTACFIYDVVFCVYYFSPY